MQRDRFGNDLFAKIISWANTKVLAWPSQIFQALTQRKRSAELFRWKWVFNSLLSVLGSINNWVKLSPEFNDVLEAARSGSNGKNYLLQLISRAKFCDKRKYISSSEMFRFGEIPKQLENSCVVSCLQIPHATKGKVYHDVLLCLPKRQRWQKKGYDNRNMITTTTWAARQISWRRNFLSIEGLFPREWLCIEFLAWLFYALTSGTEKAKRFAFIKIENDISRCSDSSNPV